MSKGTIAIRGGGAGKAFAIIQAIYPEGSTCTCSNGEKTLDAKGTSGVYIFPVPEAGTWTVTANDGTNTKSQSVEITSKGQFESVELSYWNGELYIPGDEYESVTGGWDVASWVSGWYSGKITDASTDSLLGFKVISNSGGGQFTNNTIDLTSYSKLTAVIDGASTFKSDDGNGFLVKLVVSTVRGSTSVEPQKASFAASRQSRTEPTTIELDISRITGAYYVGVYSYNGAGNVYASSIRLS